MRLVTTILAAISMLLFIGVLFFYVRSYSYYEGNVHYRTDYLGDLTNICHALSGF